MQSKEVIAKKDGVNRRYIVMLGSTGDFNIEDKPLFIDMAWRLDIVIASRCLLKTVQPKFVIRFDIADATLARKDTKRVEKVDGSVQVSLRSIRRSVFMEITPTVLDEVVAELEKGLAELRSLNTKQILRSALRDK